MVNVDAGDLLLPIFPSTFFSPKRYPGIDKIVDQTQVRKSLPIEQCPCIAAKLRFAHSIGQPIQFGWQKVQVDVLNRDEFFARKQKITM